MLGPERYTDAITWVPHLSSHNDIRRLMPDFEDDTAAAKTEIADLFQLIAVEFSYLNQNAFLCMAHKLFMLPHTSTCSF